MTPASHSGRARSALALALICTVASAHLAQAGVNVWTRHGPPGGRITTLAIDPTTPTTLYAWLGSDSGIFKSTDGGGTWSNTGGPAAVGTLAIDPQTPTTLYAATSGGVFKSTDGGGTWSAAGLSDTLVQALAIDPLTPTTLYAATSGGVFKSTDGGGTWSETGFNPSGESRTALAIDPKTPTTLYAWMGYPHGGLFKSTDGGGTWSDTGLPPFGRPLNALAIDPETPTRLYAGTEGGLFAIDQVSACVGDCNDASTVTIGELLTMVNIALGTAAVSECLAGDGNQNGAITVDEILTAVNHALSGCGD